jgi:hypothetical protein
MKAGGRHLVGVDIIPVTLGLDHRQQPRPPGTPPLINSGLRRQIRRRSRVRIPNVVDKPLSRVVGTRSYLSASE